MKEIVQAQKELYKSGVTLPEDFRRLQLEKLRKGVLKYQDEIGEALRRDLNKSEFETYETETGMVLEEISCMLKHLHKLMRPKRVATPIVHFPSTSKIYSEPYGSVLIMAPWNYPLQLALVPLAGCLAAGNCAVVKPSNYSPATSAVIKKIITESFPPEYVSVAEGGREVNQDLLDQPFDYIFFTGGTTVGKLVIEKAAQHLTPVTLELGGKSPCIVDETADITLSARRIIWGKLLNAGQTCVAPDYVLAHESIYEKLIEQMKKYIVGFYGERPLQDGNYPKIINEKHYNRLAALVEASDVIYGGRMDPDACQIEPTLIQADWDSEIMKDEIFGPLLPVVKFSSLKEASDAIKDRPKPLALYYFTTSAAGKDFVTRNISYGGGCINDTIVHLANPNIPFGGVGASGMGSYHGKESFKTFSHRKSVLEKKNWLDLPIRYTPNSQKDLKLLKILMK